MSHSRRELLAGAAALSLSAVPCLAEDKPRPATGKMASRSNPIGISTYSFWQFEHEEYRDIEKCIDLAAEWGFDGVEILHRQMTNEENGYLQKLKKRAFVNGLALMGFSTHQVCLAQGGRAEEEHRPHHPLYRVGLRPRHSHHAGQHRPLGDQQGF
ncbi:MAG: hypothetical protein ACR2FY_14510 [Pirellulaceae bacterium]